MAPGENIRKLHNTKTIQLGGSFRYYVTNLYIYPNNKFNGKIEIILYEV